MADAPDGSRFTTLTGFDPVTDDGDDSQEQIRRLYRDLELGDDPDSKNKIDLRPLLDAFEGLSSENFFRVAKDLALFLGLSGDWNFALTIVHKLETLNAEQRDTQLWKLRCLVELERHAEAIGLVHNVKWDPASLIHVNYLAGLAYEALGLTEQAQIRFKAVFEADPRYREIRQKFVT